MPTYEYACRACGHHVEVVQSFSDEPLSTCPHCGGALRKVFSPIGIVLKGSGFYKTDSRAGDGGAGAGAKRDSSAETKSGDAKAGGAKSDSSTSGGDGGSSSAGAAKGDSAKATKAAASS